MDEAILQMQFSEKDASRWIKSTLALARDHAVDYKGLKRSRLVVGQSSSTAHGRSELKDWPSRVVGVES